jgi:hypothetical protein
VVSVEVVSGSSPEDPRVTLRVDASDADGRLSQLVIDWDDNGQQTVIPYSYDSCPSALASAQTANADYAYALAGTHNITVTATSTDCAGSSVQQSIAVTTATTGGWSASNSDGGPILTP